MLLALMDFIIMIIRSKIIFIIYVEEYFCGHENLVISCNNIILLINENRCYLLGNSDNWIIMALVECLQLIH